MAVVWLVRAYTPPLSAPGAGVDRHYHFARALVARGHDVTLITSAIARWDGQSEGLPKGVNFIDEVDDRLTVRILRGRPYSTIFERFISMVHFDLMVLRSTRDLPPPDVVMGTSVHPFAAHAGQALARRHRVPFILEIGDIWPRTLVDLGALSRWHPGYWVLRMLELRLYQKAVRILSKIPLARIHVAASRADPTKVIYLPNGVDVSPYLADDYPAAPPSREKFVVVYAGGMTPIYGLENLIDAAALVADQHPELPIVFRLVGSGPLRAKLQNHASGRGLSNVEFLDRVPWTQVPTVLADADVCVAMARDIDVVRDYGMSHNKVYEYLGASRPIIFSVASANDPIAEAGAGISVQPESARAIAEAVVDLFQRSRLQRIQMGQRGQAFVRRGYTIDAISDRFARIVDEVLQGLPPGATVHSDDLQS